MRRLPGFDPLRLIAASAVVFTHSFLIAEGVEWNEPFQIVSGQNIGLAGVYVFFVLSGFLISESARRSTKFSAFAVKRGARIFPAFLVCNLLVVLICGAAYSNENMVEFFRSISTWKDLANVYLLQEKNLYYEALWLYPAAGENYWMPHLLNGVLWTIRQELTCYLFVALILVVGWHGWRSAAAALCCAAAINFIYFNVPTLWPVGYISDLRFVAPSFAIGVCLNGFFRNHAANGWIASMLFAATVGLAIYWPHWAEWANIIFPMLMAYPLLWFGQRDTAVIRWYSRWGDPSYGTYLWGWPITQVIRSIVGPSWSGYHMAAIALPFVVMAGYASWYLIEAPALRIAERFRRS